MITLNDYRPPDFAIDEIDLVFKLDPAATRVHACYRVRRVDDDASARPLVLDGTRLTLEGIALNGTPLTRESYRQQDEQLIIEVEHASFELAIDTVIDPANNTRLEGLYFSNGRFYTQCEPQGFRNITFALDRPDSPSRFQVRIEANQRQYPTLLSNGDLVETGILEGGRHFAVWRDPYPKPTYLFALVAGSFDTVQDTFVTFSGRAVALTIHVDEGEAPRAVYAMDALKRAMAWDETVFHREYDLGEFHIVAVRDFNSGAMENKGLNLFNASRVLADFETATDADFKDIERVVAHEYFHNWTGNRVTLRDWFQLCLKEGLTVYRDQEFSADQRSRAVERIAEVKLLRELQFPEDAGPLAHAVRPLHYERIDNFYTATVYRKGAELVRVLSVLIGDEAFARGMQLFFRRWDGFGVTLEQFLRCFEEEGHRDLSEFFRWYTQAGTPRLVARGVYESGSGIFRLTVSQSTPPTPGEEKKLALTIPLRVGFLSFDGAELTARLQIGEAPRAEWNLVLDRHSTTFVFEGVEAPPIPSILRGFCAPVLLDDGLGQEERFVQMGSDPDPFTRWEAGQYLLTEAIFSEARGAADRGPSIDRIASALMKEMDRTVPDTAFAAAMLSVPAVRELMYSGDVCDIAALIESRNRVRQKLAAALDARLAAAIQQPGDEPVSLNQDQVGRRAIKTVALHLLASRGRLYQDLIASAFKRANTMTERMAALEALGEIEGDCFDEALQIFLERWRHHALVVDKWFSVQAAAMRDDAPSRVRLLAEHELFSLRNPNRVRALYGAFGSANLRAFHAIDGSGYSFVADGIRQVDALNPIVAARLIKAFESWRRLDMERQRNARKALEALRAEALSPNAKELIEQLLA